MNIIHMKVGAIGTNCYIVYNETNKGLIIDPGDNAKEICEILQKNNIELEYILLTHGHFDHILAVSEIKDKAGAKVVIHKNDVNYLDKKTVERYGVMGYNDSEADIQVQDGDVVTVSGITATFIHTPGHTPGSSVIKIDNALFTGDTLFRGECGRCDLPGGDFGTMLKSLKSLYDLDGDYDVFPGHEEFSTLDWERKNNQYMKMALK